MPATARQPAVPVTPSLLVYRADESCRAAIAAVDRAASVGPVSASMKSALLSAVARIDVHPTIDRGAR